MGKKTSIEWCARHLPDGTIVPGMTYNPWWGCFKIADGCKNCYAETLSVMYGKKVWGPASTTQRWTFQEKHWKEPITWNRMAENLGHRANVFCASMADVFEDHPQLPPERLKLWDLIEKTPWLNWLLLTKRPENILKMTPWHHGVWPDNVWAGTSIARQKDAEENLFHLLQVPSVVRFVSVEPQLEEITLTPWLPYLQWVICGGESGPKHRPFDPEWARSLRDQCLSHQVPFHFKQHGGLRHNSGGRILDGRTWDYMPPEFPLTRTI